LYVTFNFILCIQDDFQAIAPLDACLGIEGQYFNEQSAPSPDPIVSRAVDMSAGGSLQHGCFEALLDYSPFNIDFLGIMPSVAEIQHAVLSPDQQSAYSELSANVVYMATLSEEADKDTRESCSSMPIRRRKEKASTKIKEKTYKTTLEVANAPQAALISEIGWTRENLGKPGGGIGKKQTGERSVASGSHIPFTSVGSKPAMPNRNLPPKRIPPPITIGKVRKMPSVGSSAGKKLGLACLFCRERKIACGRPSESNPDQTCK
jgi:hypothetical protein